MTPEQKTALEGLIERPLTSQEISSLEPLFSARDDVAIANILSFNRTKMNGLSKGMFQIWAAKTGQRAVIEDHATNPDSPLRSIALTIRDFIFGTVSEIQFSNADNQYLLAQWVDGGAMTQEQADDLLMLGTIPDPIHFNLVSDALNIAEGRASL